MIESACLNSLLRSLENCNGKEAMNLEEKAFMVHA